MSLKIGVFYNRSPTQALKFLDGNSERDGGALLHR